MGDKYVDELLGPIEPEPEDEVPIGTGSLQGGSETEDPEIQPMSTDENESMPAAAYEGDKLDIVEAPGSVDGTPEVQGSTHQERPDVSEPPANTPETLSDTPVPIAKPSREEGLRKEIVRLRAELKKGEVTSLPIAPLPVPPVPGASSPPAPGTGNPPAPVVPGAQVVVSEDGSTVYLPDEEITRRVQEQVQAAMQPSPAQQAGMAAAQMENQFVMENPERNQPAVRKFRDVDEYLGLKLQGLQAQGYTPQSVPDLIQTMRVMGVEQEFATYFPETAPMFDELIAAVSSQQPAWRRSILDRMAMNGSSAPTEAGDAVVPEPTLQSVKDMPQSLARKGGSRSQAPVADKSEFKILEDGFHADPVGFPKAKYTRYQELGRKLGEDGFESI